MTPSEIAKEAGDLIAHLANQCCNRSDGFEEDIAQKAQAIILSAAAKMVRESGAIEAMNKCRFAMLGRVKGNDPAWNLSDSALSKLRSLTEHKGEGRP